VTKEIREEITKFLDSNENENTTYQTLGDTVKAMLRGRFRAISAYIRETETSQTNNLMMHLKFLEKQEQTKPQTSGLRKISKIRTEINENKTKKIIQRVNETKSWFFEKIKKIINPSPT
jgi:hypothetical protein